MLTAVRQVTATMARELAEAEGAALAPSCVE